MRGNLSSPDDHIVACGSIPAHAGEPSFSGCPGHLKRVYPRACGGTSNLEDPHKLGEGLSPRMRGNRCGARQTASHPGSIPAHAGEPSSHRPSARRSWVYPRACGGTKHAGEMTELEEGLSPRMRGNRRNRGLRCLQHGSIPAHAGEPDYVPFYRVMERVYPRACGGTAASRGSRHEDLGLSPRMRGNHGVLSPVTLYLGSIPAHAGEPGDDGEPAANGGVYPRACGGTMTLSPSGSRISGLSPRMRGNLRNRGLRCLQHGSIPAHAGEPID